MSFSKIYCLFTFLTFIVWVPQASAASKYTLEEKVMQRATERARVVARNIKDETSHFTGLIEAKAFLMEVEDLRLPTHSDFNKSLFSQTRTEAERQADKLMTRTWLRNTAASMCYVFAAAMCNAAIPYTIRTGTYLMISTAVLSGLLLGKSLRMTLQSQVHLRGILERRKFRLESFQHHLMGLALETFFKTLEEEGVVLDAQELQEIRFTLMRKEKLSQCSLSLQPALPSGT